MSALRSAVAGVGALALAVPAARAALQASPEQQAAALLADGQRYMREGLYPQALDNFNTIVKGFAGTQSVDDALIGLGRYQWEVESDLAAARASFQQVTQQFPQSDGAPGAYYYLGRLTLDEATSQEQLADAKAQFDRVQTLYPKSPWVPYALHGQGLVERKGGNLEAAVEHQRRVAMEHPASPIAPEAQFEVGHLLALLGETQQAMEEFQRVRNEFPSSPLAERALERITALYRFRGGEPRYRRDASYSVGAGDVLRDVRALLVDREGNVWLASDKTRSAVPFAPDGTMGASFSGRDLGDLSLAPDGAVVVTAETAVRVGRRAVQSFAIPGDRPGDKPEPLDKITAAIVLPGGDFLVADEDQKAVIRFDAEGKHLGAFPDSREREVTRLAMDSEGGIAMLDERAERIEVYDANGQALRALPFRGAGYELREPTDLAIDQARHTYVADEKAAAVFIFSPSGEPMGSLGRGELRKPVALALEPSGAVLVYDEDERRVFRYH